MRKSAAKPLRVFKHMRKVQRLERKLVHPKRGGSAEHPTYCVADEDIV